MKTTQPQISLRVEESKKRKSDGLSPLYIVVSWKGRVKEATGIYIKPEQLKNNTIKGNSRANQQLQNRLAEIDDNIKLLLATRQPFTASQVLEKQKARITILSVSRKIQQVKHLKDSTMSNYTQAHKHLLLYFGQDYDLQTITLADIQGFARTLSKDHKPTAICGILNVIKSTYTFAHEYMGMPRHGVMDWHHKRDGYAPARNPKAVTTDQLDELIIIASAKDCPDKNLQEAAKIWLSGFYFGGLALCDLMRVRWDEVINSVEYIDNQPVVSFEIYRSKTQQLAKVVTLFTSLTSSLLVFLALKPWGKRTPQQYSGFINNQLKKLDKSLTYYACRHTFCTQLVQSQANISDIATMMGRSINGIATYIKQVTDTQHLAVVAAKLHGIDTKR